MFKNSIFVTLRQVKIVKDRRFLFISVKNVSNTGGGDSGNDENPASKLNSLLLSIAKDDKTEASEFAKIELPKSRVKHRLKSDKIAQDQKIFGSRLVKAAIDVADKLGGDTKKTEIELLQKVLYKNSPVRDEIMKSSSGNQSLVDLLSKMDVERQVESQKTIKDQMPTTTKTKRFSGKHSIQDKSVPRRQQRVNLFGEEPLGIFNVQDGSDTQLETWHTCEERDKKLSVSHPPSNYFEQLIDWTNKGIIWKFPIDNEQGLDAEKDVSFASHVLLESHLENWCPTAGPIRHFMELVCVGLSRNHWLSAVEKEDHIKWYRDFFAQRKQLIKEIGAGDIKTTDESVEVAK